MIPEIQALIEDIERTALIDEATAEFLVRIARVLRDVQEGLRQMEINDRQYIWNAIHKLADAAKVEL